MFIELTVGNAKQLINVYEISYFKPFKDGDKEVCVMKTKDSSESRIAESYEEVRELLYAAGVYATSDEEDDEDDEDDDEDEDEDDDDDEE
ncbi:MAG: hypothetical protein SGJ27_13115 [Candidatus Melainabacteria bacterium]|nr:hypothetical protein [Candidatus Melainabacteria bacterium]